MDRYRIYSDQLYDSLKSIDSQKVKLPSIYNFIPFETKEYEPVIQIKRDE